MKREIIGRRKRFFVFMLALVLVCSSVRPTRVEAEDSYTNSRESLLEGQILIEGNTITAETDCMIGYFDYSGNEVKRVSLYAGDKYIIEGYSTDVGGVFGELDNPDIFPELAPAIFGGWEVYTDPNSSGDYLEAIALYATRNDVEYNVDTGILKIKKIYLEDDFTEFVIDEYQPMNFKAEGDISKIVYTAQAMSDFKEDFKYQGNTYKNPGVELIVDYNYNDYGVYNVNEEKNELTIYAVPQNSDRFFVDEALGTARYVIFENYYMDDSTWEKYNNYANVEFGDWIDNNTTTLRITKRARSTCTLIFMLPVWAALYRSTAATTAASRRSDR